MHCLVKKTATNLDWLSVHQQRLKDAHERAREYTELKAAERIAQHSHKVYCPSVEVGEYVYLRHRPAGRNKIQDAWSPIVYQVVDVVGTTYTVQPAEGGPSKRVNRVDVRPCNLQEGIPKAIGKTVNQPTEIREPNTNTCEEGDDGIILEEVSFEINPKLVVTNGQARDCAQLENSPLVSYNEHSVTENAGTEHVETETCTSDQSCELQAAVTPCVNRAPIPAPRKSKRTTAGKHPNPHNEPRSVLEPELSSFMVSQIIASLGAVFFREALKEVKRRFSVTEDVDD